MGDSTRRFRWYSTPQSAQNGEITRLAIGETLMAMAGSILIAWYYETLLVLAFSTCLAPLLLLRTSRSTELGLKWYSKQWNTLLGWNLSAPMGSALIVSYFIVMPALSLLVRTVATLTTSIRHPIEALAAIPANWRRVAVCTDSMHPPEPVPGLELMHARVVDRGPSFALFAQMVRDAIGGVKKHKNYKLAFSLSPVVALLLFGLLVSLVYRWSLKATSLIYSPLVFIVHSNLLKGIVLEERLDTIRSWALFRVMRWYAVVLLVLLAVKGYIFFNWAKVVGWWNELELASLLHLLIQPTKVPAWQVATFLNCLIALGLYFFADLALIKLKHGTWTAPFVERTLRATGLIRGGLSLYTISCTLYLVGEAAWDWSLPPLEVVLFPWSK